MNLDCWKSLTKYTFLNYTATYCLEWNDSFSQINHLKANLNLWKSYSPQ